MKRNKLLEIIRSKITPEQHKKLDKIIEKMFNTEHKDNFRGYWCEDNNKCSNQCNFCKDGK